MELLEHESDRSATQSRTPRIVEPTHVLAVDQNCPRGRKVEDTEQAEHRGLSRARRAHDRDEIAGHDPQRHVLEGVDHRFLAVGPCDLVELEQRSCEGPLPSRLDHGMYGRHWDWFTWTMTV